MLTHLTQALERAGGWLSFEQFMNLALYTPDLGYYSKPGRIFGPWPKQGSDFVTAPEMSPLFAQALSQQVAQAMAATHTTAIWEFGAGSGALAAELLQSLGDRISHYTIVDLSAHLQARQRETVTERAPQWADRLSFATQWPQTIEGVVIGNEVLDAMPVTLLHFDGQRWWERGISLAQTSHSPSAAHPAALNGSVPPSPFIWSDRPTTLKPPVDMDYPPGTITEIHRHAEGYIRSLGAVLKRGAAFFIDYGFPEAEYYHPQRHGGTLMCHHRHQADTDPLTQVGDKDITAHVNFTGIAVAAQEADLTVLGYTTQARFLMNCGLLPLMAQANPLERHRAHALIAEHEMGELFKVIGLAPSPGFDALGFMDGDRTHTL